MPDGGDGTQPDPELLTWETPAEQRAYRRAVNACLKEPAISKKVDKRPGATKAEVLAAMSKPETVSEALRAGEPWLFFYRAAAGKLADAEDRYAVQRWRTAWDVRTALLAGWLVLLPLLLLLGGPVLLLGAGHLLLLAVLVLLVGRHPRARRNARNLLSLVRAWLDCRWWRRSALRKLKLWEVQLKEQGVRPLMTVVVDGLLGDDPESLLLAERYDGLKDSRNPAYIVPGKAAEQLQQKLARLRGGTIAICGPRGVGKSTLLEQAAEPDDFTVSVQAPATYTPAEFLATLFGEVCEEYLRQEKQEIPDVNTLTGVKWRRLARRAGRGLRWLLCTVLAAALMAFGVADAVRGVVSRHGDALGRRFADLAHGALERTSDVWEGGTTVARVLLVVAAVVVWKWRRSGRMKGIPRTARYWGCAAGALLLLYLGADDVLLDESLPRLAHRFAARLDGTLLAVLLIVAGAVLWALRDDLSYAPTAPWVYFPAAFRRLLSVLSLGLAAIGLVLVQRSAAARVVLLDEDMALRVALVAVAVLLWRRRAGATAPKSELVEECRGNLYRLRTVQNESRQVNAGLPQWLNLGATRASSWSSVPHTFPELVTDFRELLERIAGEKSIGRSRVVIAIDELDRLGSAEEARRFLGEIKAIFGIRNVYYLISVSEDIAAAFVRRGLPHRDTTDSSLDDVLHVQPRTLDESHVLLAKRVPELSEPYVCLAHALSGGIPRDLIRYARRLLEVQEHTSAVELTDLARGMILAELAATLEGFRTLLAKESWTAASSGPLHGLHMLVRTVQAAGQEPERGTVRWERVHRMIADFAASPMPRGTRGGMDGDPASVAAALTENAAALLDEASAYTYFSLTLLDIFGRDGFGRRKEAANASGPIGSLQLLSEARQELSISPYSARAILEEARRAWGLAAAV